MATLKKIATQIIDRLGVPYNDSIYEDIKEHVVHYRNVFIKREIDKNRIDERYQLPYDVEVKKVDSIKHIFDTAVIGAKTQHLYVYKTVNPIPTVVNTFRSSPFTKIYAKEGILQHDIMFVSSSLMPDYHKTRLSKNKDIYTISNGIVTIISNRSFKTLTIEEVFEYPLIITGDYGEYNIAGIVFNDTAEYPIDSNMIPMVIEPIIKLYDGNSTKNIPVHKRNAL